MDKINIKKGKADGKIYDVITFDEYNNQIQNDVEGDIAIEEGDYIYPRRTANENKPGLYGNNVYSIYKHPETEEEKNEYSISNVIDFNSESLADHINKANKLKSMEREILTSTGDIFTPPIHINDEPEMIALKKAVTAKGINLNNYAHRFESNFQNDRRYFFKNKISMDKFKMFLDIFDMKGTITIQDKNPDVPNPMGTVIEIDLNDGGELTINEQE